MAVTLLKSKNGVSKQDNLVHRCPPTFDEVIVVDDASRGETVTMALGLAAVHFQT